MKTLSKVSSVIMIIISFSITIYRVMHSPDEIALHYDLHGNIDSYGPKYVIFLLPIIGVSIFLMLRLYKKDPFRFRFNMYESTPNTPLNKVILQRCALFTALITILLILYITVCSAGYLPLHNIIIVAIVVSLIGIQIYFYWKIIRDK